jgi:hypothetical protein
MEWLSVGVGLAYRSAPVSLLQERAIEAVDWPAIGKFPCAARAPEAFSERSSRHSSHILLEESLLARLAIDDNAMHGQ